MSEYLREFVPTSFTSEVHFRREIIPAVRRLASLLPKDRIWEAYSTAKDSGQTGGHIVFPYYRLDMSLFDCESNLARIDRARTPERATSFYSEAVVIAFSALVWVEIGFGGLEQLMQNRMAVGNTTIGDDEARNKALRLVMRQQYQRVMGDFAQARMDRGTSDDDFVRFNLEHLLCKFRTPEIN